ncbi:flagellar filament capping protein FliD [Paenibacillus xylanilyticus]|uniref:Flagellar hook-associated protein 2 n=1 Tax=Paenibacillus xylanilyticus TaxID=248903 RepID=A0A7Y6BUK2_9BACL|nr:flagellar filament capping protein FliD [Paenibacillus xylanilyticus]NUU74823.1 flagellar filament capping protein FliD [Paenibacillus xylanilyticus]
MRINGFSGMDIDSMVKELMTAKRAPLDKLNQKKTLLEWQRDSYRELNSKMYEFRNTKLQNTYRQSAALNTQKAVVTGNTDAVKAEAGAAANGIKMEVSVEQLATAKAKQTDGKGLGYNSKQSLAELEKGIKSGESTASLGTSEYEKKYKIKINDVEMTFTGQDTVSSVIAKINSNSSMNVKASFDELTGKFTVSAIELGGSGKLELGTLKAEENSMFDVFGGNLDDVENSGLNASVSINGVKLSPPPTSNVITYNGVQMNLLKETVTKTKDSNGNDIITDNPFTITTQSDPDKALETVKAFIEDYNKMLVMLNTKIGEEKYRTFQPLTSEQRSAMSESDIKLWEEKAKSGLLKNDDILTSLASTMRTIMGEKMGELSNIGITGGKYYENGKIYLDEEKFKTAIMDNPQQISDLLQGTGTGADNSIFGKLYKEMDTAMTKVAERAGTTKFSGDVNSLYKEESVMGKTLKGYNTEITALERRLTDMENRYYKQFTAMETAMTKYQNQASSLSSFFAS